MTELIVRGRRNGKTAELVRRSAETGATIVCTDHRRARQIAELADTLGLRIPFPMTAAEWREQSYYPPGMRGLLVDDLDRIIQGMSAVPVIAATWTAEDTAAEEP